MKFLNIIVNIAALMVISACVPLALGGVGAVGYTAAQQRSVGTTIDDNAISAYITSLYLQKDVNNLLSHVGVEVVEGKVLLTGSVPSANDRIEAARLAWQPKGVKEVINEIKVNDVLTLGDRAEDTWITAQIKSKMLFNKDVNIRGINYNIETVRGIVYLLGVAENASELADVTYIASTTPGVKRVVSHVRVGNNADKARKSSYSYDSEPRDYRYPN